MEEEWSEMDRLELQKWIFLEPKMDWNASPYVSSLLSSLVTFEYVSFYKEMCLLVGQSEHACTLSAVLARSAYVRWMASGSMRSLKFECLASLPVMDILLDKWPQLS